MKIGITYRLFLSILGATCLAVLAMFLIMEWSINRGFYQYLGTMEEGVLDQMAPSLEQAYAEHGNWDFLRNNPGPWMRQMLHAGSGQMMPERFRRFDDTGNMPPPRMGRGMRGPGSPLIILDAERKPIIGSLSRGDEVNFRSLVHQGKTVGYVGLLPPRHFLHPMQVRFLSQQHVALAVAAGGMVFVVVLVSLPLARRLVRPIKAMADATHDISSGKYATRIPDTSSDELGQLARDFNAMALTLEKNEKERRQWVADISHELRTPIAVLRGEIEALLDQIRTITPETIRSLHAEVLRLNRLVEDLYQLSLYDIGALTFRKENLDLVEVLRDSMESFRAEFVRKGIALTAKFSEHPAAMVFADRERLNQLFANLFENSLRYTDAGGGLDIGLAVSGEKAVIEFQDSAPGVPEKELSRLFERLYRVEGSRSRASGGAGLGLAICKNIVEAHEGTISGHASSLGGLLVRISLPIKSGSATKAHKTHNKSDRPMKHTRIHEEK
jgi:two-component system, OmpR family, sensor histidine kinase BaeS